MKMQGNDFEYYNAKEKTDKARLGAFFTVGDIGYFAEDGFLFLNDRSNAMIIAGGVNIYPAEIEGVIQQHDKVLDVAVFGIPNPDMGEEIKAVVELLPGVADAEATRSSIEAFYQDKMTKQKGPHSIDFTTEMPRDPNGKLYKRKLRDPYWEDHEGRIV